MSSQTTLLGSGAVLGREMRAQVQKLYGASGASNALEFYNVSSGADKKGFAISSGLHDDSAAHPGLEFAFHDGDDARHQIFSLGYVNNDYLDESDPSGHGRPAVIIGDGSADDKVDLVVQGGGDTYMVFDSQQQQLRLGSAASQKSEGAFVKISPGAGYTAATEAVVVDKGSLKLTDGNATLADGNLTLQDGDISVLLGSSLFKSGDAADDYRLHMTGKSATMKAGAVTLQDDTSASAKLEDGAIQMIASSSSVAAQVLSRVGAAADASRAVMQLQRDAAAEDSYALMQVVNTDGSMAVHEASVRADLQGVAIKAASKKVVVEGPLEMKQAAGQTQNATLAYNLITSTGELVAKASAADNVRMAISGSLATMKARADGVANYTSSVRVGPSEVGLIGYDGATGNQNARVRIDTAASAISIVAEDTLVQKQGADQQWLFDEDVFVTFTEAPTFLVGITVPDLTVTDFLTVGGLSTFNDDVSVVEAQLLVKNAAGTVFRVDPGYTGAAGTGGVFVDGSRMAYIDMDASQQISMQIHGAASDTGLVAQASGDVQLKAADTLTLSGETLVDVISATEAIITAPEIKLQSDPATAASYRAIEVAGSTAGGKTDAVTITNAVEFAIDPATLQAGSTGGLQVRTNAHFEKDVVMDARLIIHGDLDVKGNLNSINTTETQLYIQDKTIHLNQADDAEASLDANDTGLQIRKGAIADADVKSMLYKELDEENAVGPDATTRGVFQFSNSVHIKAGATEAAFDQVPALYFGGAAGELPEWRIAVVDGKLKIQKRMPGDASAAPEYQDRFIVDAEEISA